MKPSFSNVIQGCMTWGIWGKDLTTRDMADRINLALQLGISTFDHADIYGDYTTEAAFGKALIESAPRYLVELICVDTACQSSMLSGVLWALTSRSW